MTNILKLSEQLKCLQDRGQKFDLDYGREASSSAKIGNMTQRRRQVTVGSMPKLSDDQITRVMNIITSSAEKAVSKVFDNTWSEYVKDAVTLLPDGVIENSPRRVRFYQTIRGGKQIFDETVDASEDVRIFEIVYSMNPSDDYFSDTYKFSSGQRDVLFKPDGSFKVLSFYEKGSVFIAVRYADGKPDSIIGVKCECRLYYVPMCSEKTGTLYHMKLLSDAKIWFGEYNTHNVIQSIVGSHVPKRVQDVPGYIVCSSSNVAAANYIVRTVFDYTWLMWRVQYALERCVLIHRCSPRSRDTVDLLCALNTVKNVWYAGDHLSKEDNEFMSSIVKDWEKRVIPIIR